MSVMVGGLTLDDSYSPNVNISFEYFKTQSGEIIGGNQIATISGIVVVGDGPNNQNKTGSIVMAKLKSIRDIGRSTSCMPVNIPGFSGNEGKVTNVSIEQGPDPAWINQGAFTIEVKAPLGSIPTNSYGIVAADCVTDINRSETLEIGEDSHGFVFTSDKQLSKAFVRFTDTISLTCKPLCSSNGNAGGLVFSVLQKLLKIGIDNKIFNPYKSWSKYLQNRSLEINTDGSITFKADMILTPPGQGASAFVDLSFGHSRDYQSKTTTKTTSGSVTGLASVPWSNPISLSDTFSASKLGNALGAFGHIKGKYNKLASWKGTELELIEKPNCPVQNNNSIGQCRKDPDDDDQDKSGCVEPSMTTVSISRTDGTINFNFEWSSSTNNNECIVNGVKKEITVDITDPQPQYVEHILPSIGTLIQNLNCNNAKRVSITFSVTSPDDACNQSLGCEINEGIDIEVSKYLSDGTYLIIGHTKNIGTNNITIKQDFIKCT